MTTPFEDAPARKAMRLRAGRAPNVLDLFSGCGGMSLGFQRAGCEIIGGLELEPVRAQTHARNFHGRKGEELKQIHGASRDVTSLDPHDFLKAIGAGPRAIDIIVGGPPCQAYARVGRAKLREIGRHPTAHLHDQRGGLYAAYTRYVAALRPVAVVMENVPDILSYGGVNIAEVIAEGLDELGYDCRYTLLNAAHYGVPQTRERWYLVGIHRDAAVEPRFPAPTHSVDLPPGYRGTRSHALAWVFRRPPHATLLTEASKVLPAGVTCEQALSDLPVVTREQKMALRRGARDLAERQHYACPPSNHFQETMRNWPGFPANQSVSAHAIRRLPRDYPIFEQMSPGDDYPAAFAIAEGMFRTTLKRRRAAGKPVVEESEEWAELRAEIVPPYDPGKFPNKWRKLEAAFPSRTLLAHLSHDTYSHIHYDSQQARTISVREAARLQSFPDGFEFCGAMNAAFGQIGNAVPPLMAAALAGEVCQILRRPSVNLISVGQRARNDSVGGASWNTSS